MASCVESGSEKISKCLEEEDPGWFGWVAKATCVVTTVTTSTACVLVDVATTVVNAAVVTVESVVGWVASGAAFVGEMLQAVPFLGAGLRWLNNIVSTVIWTIFSIPDAVLGLIGIKPEKRLRVCTIILRDESGVPTATVGYAVALLQLAADIFKRDANVRMLPLHPFRYVTPFQPPETVTADWVQVDGGASDSDLLDPPCGAAAEWLLGGTKRQWKLSTMCFFGAWRRMSGYGAPVTCFVVRSVPGAAGCSLWITDYATLIGGSAPPLIPRLLAHEVGHSANLWHLCVNLDPTNLMATTTACPTVNTPAGPVTTATGVPDNANPHMEDWQVLLVRASKHVTFF